MNYRIDPSELVPRPGARRRILEAGKAYQAASPPVAVDRYANKKAAELSALLAKALIEAIDSLPREIDPPDYALDIMREVATKHGLGIGHLRGTSRRATIVRARQEACYRLYGECPDLSMPKIGQFLGNRDHTTVLSAIREHAKRNGLPTITRVYRARDSRPKRQWRAKAK